MRTLSSIRLTDNQKRVLARIIAAPTPKVAADEISNGKNMIGARDILIQLGLIHFANDDAVLTDQGMQIMKSEALVDDSGQLTPDGQEFAHTDPSGQPTRGQVGSPPATSDVTGGQPELQLQHDNYFERMLLLKELING